MKSQSGKKKVRERKRGIKWRVKKKREKRNHRWKEKEGKRKNDVS